MSQPPVVQVFTKLVWKDGFPCVQEVPELFSVKDTEEKLKNLAKISLNLPYTGPDPELKGLTKGEAMIVGLVDSASKGNSKDRRELLDRLLGRPQQNIKSTRVNMDLNTYLESIADPIDAEDVSREIEDGEVSDPYDL